MHHLIYHTWQTNASDIILLYFFGMIGVQGQERLSQMLSVPFPYFVGWVSDILREEEGGEKETAE